MAVQIDPKNVRGQIMRIRVTLQLSTDLVPDEPMALLDCQNRSEIDRRFAMSPPALPTSGTIFDFRRVNCALLSLGVFLRLHVGRNIYGRLLGNVVLVWSIANNGVGVWVSTIVVLVGAGVTGTGRSACVVMADEFFIFRAGFVLFIARVCVVAVVVWEGYLFVPCPCRR